MRGAIACQRMVDAFDAENDVVGREIDFDHDMFRGHFAKQAGGIILIENIDTMADALRMSQLDGFADVKA